ncbi:MAG: tRNA dihydrouridine synthase [Candidatus Woesearchaeota archaeon]
MTSLPINGRFILAPMAGVSDASFRELCRGFGAALTVTELTSVEGVVRKERSLRDVLDVRPGEGPSVQLFGNDIDAVVRAAKVVEPYASVIDVNLGCPAPHINAQRAGAALLTEREHLKRLFSSLVEAVDVPVTAKIRAGPTHDNLVYREVALALQDAGVSMVTLHARTVSQGYSGEADWSMIKELVELLDIPVCGNGDVTTPEQAKRMLDETGCRYVMVGRGAMGNPFIFRQCDDYLEKGSYETPTDEERLQAWERYLEKAIEYQIEFSRIKSQAMMFSKGFYNAKGMRRRIAQAGSVEELRGVFAPCRRS